MRLLKFAVGGTLVLADLAVRTWLSGFLALRLLRLPPMPVTWHLYADYLRALDLPTVHPYAGRIRAAGGIGFGVATLALAPAHPGEVAPFRRQPAHLTLGIAHRAE